MQRNWIGRSNGVVIEFKCNGTKLPVFTTRPDTLPGATFIVMAPDNDDVAKFVTEGQADNVFEYQEQVKNMSEMERQLNKDKTGVFTGSYAINPLNQEKIPV